MRESVLPYPAARKDLFVYLLVLFFLFDYMTYIAYPLRYIKYAFPVVAWLFYSLRTNKTVPNTFTKVTQFYILRILKLYLWLYGANLLLSWIFNEISWRFFANAYFVIAPIAAVFFMLPFLQARNKGLYFTVLFWGAAIGFFLEQGPALLHIFSSFNLQSFLFDSESETESNLYPFIFSFLFLFAVTGRLPMLYKIASVLFLILGSKRIVLLSIALLFLLYLLITYRNFLINPVNRKLIAGVFVGAALLLTYGYFRFSNGYFDDTIENAFGISANQLAQGRQFLYKQIIDQVKWSDYFTGEGLGSVDHQVALITAQREGGQINNLHSEILRNFIELGIVLFIIWIFCKIRYILVNRFTLLALIFLFFSLITDNILIYFECMFIMYLLIVLSFLNEKFFYRLQGKQGE